MLSGEGQHHLASAAVAVCKGIECLLEVLCLEHMRGDLIDLFQVVRQDLDHLGELLVLMTGSQKDILQFVSSLMKLVRKNHWYIVMPGQLSDGKTKTNLSLVLITQHRVIGLKCYGYGGALTNNGKAADWTQKLDKTTKAIHSPLPDQTAQQAALASLLPQLNASQVEVFSVFTTPGVQLINCSGLNCFTSVSLLEKLQSSSADCAGPLQPKELGTALEAMKPDPPAKNRQ